VFGFMKKTTSYRIEKMYLHIPPELHTLMTSLTHPRKILLVVVQIRKAKDLSEPLRSYYACRR
jgi:hypothetical protein